MKNYKILHSQEIALTYCYSDFMNNLGPKVVPLFMALLFFPCALSGFKICIITLALWLFFLSFSVGISLPLHIITIDKEQMLIQKITRLRPFKNSKTRTVRFDGIKRILVAYSATRRRTGVAMTYLILVLFENDFIEIFENINLKIVESLADKIFKLLPQDMIENEGRLTEFSQPRFKPWNEQPISPEYKIYGEITLFLSVFGALFQNLFTLLLIYDYPPSIIVGFFLTIVPVILGIVAIKKNKKVNYKLSLAGIFICITSILINFIIMRMFPVC
nr:hypothetical protein [Candidatus Sigynarchaeota archaeon]